jgi:hypothetical protein
VKKKWSVLKTVLFFQLAQTVSERTEHRKQAFIVSRPHDSRAAIPIQSIENQILALVLGKTLRVPETTVTAMLREAGAPSSVEASPVEASPVEASSVTGFSTTSVATGATGDTALELASAAPEVSLDHILVQCSCGIALRQRALDNVSTSSTKRRCRLPHTTVVAGSVAFKETPCVAFARCQLALSTRQRARRVIRSQAEVAAHPVRQ